MTAQRLSDEELSQLELAGTSAAEDIAEYTTRRGTPTYDDRRVGRMLARESWVALAPRLIAEVRHYRALMGTSMPDAIRYLTPNAMRHGDGKMWVEASGIGGCWTPEAAIALGAALVRAGLEAKGEK